MRLVPNLGRRFLSRPVLPSSLIFRSLRTMSTKTLPVLDANQLADGQMKEVAFDDGKVLVARLGDKVVSTSAYCTHYGAPLAKGVLSADGRITCPWHGACFNACTGDIEDAPAFFGIHSFPAKVEDGKIHVTADPKFTKKDDNLVRQATIPEKLNLQESTGVVIIGGGSGALHTIESLRENGYTEPITVISKESYVPIDRTKLSKALPTQVSKVQLRTPEELRDRYGVSFKTNATATSVDTGSKIVKYTTQSDTTELTLPYTTLVLAVGALPRRLPIPNADLSNVFTLRFLEDAQKIDQACKTGTRLVVIGTSFISMEVANTLAKKVSSVHMIGMESTPFEMIMGKEVGEGLKEVLGKGITFHMEASVDSITASSANPPLATGVKLKDGTVLEADVIILGVGVAPATQFLANGNSGIKLEKDGGIVVDEYLRVPGVENVFAIGDIAMFPQTENRSPRRIEHWNVAGNHGRAVGRTIAGKGHPFSKIPIFWSAQGLRYCGLGGKSNYDDIFIKGNPKEGKFVAWYFKDGKVTAVASMGSDPVVMKSSELMRLGIMPSAEEIKNGADVLQIDISSSKAKETVEKLKSW